MARVQQKSLGTHATRARIKPSTAAPSHLETVQALHGFLVLLRVRVWLLRLRVHSFAVVCVLLDPGTRSSQSVYLCTMPNALARRAMPPTLRPYTATYPLPQLKVAGDSIVDRSHHFYLRYPCALVPFVLGVRHVADGLHWERRRRTHREFLQGTERTTAWHNLHHVLVQPIPAHGHDGHRVRIQATPSLHAPHSTHRLLKCASTSSLVALYGNPVTWTAYLSDTNTRSNSEKLSIAHAHTLWASPTHR